MTRCHCYLAPVVTNLTLVVLAAAAFAADAEKGLRNPFFVFDNGLGGIPDPPALLKELGYAGLGARGVKLAPIIQQCEQHGLKVFNTYVGCQVGKTPAIDPAFVEGIKALQGTNVVLWLYVTGGKPGQNDAEAVAVVREIADLANQSGLRVALYPHTGFYVATTADALRIVKQVDRPNVGVSINLCHELMTGHGQELDETIRLALPHLDLVSINGADRKEGAMGWDRLIQPLGQGNFDVYGFLKKLTAAGYRGPIGLQCYGVKGDAKQNLTHSMTAWRQYAARLANE